MVKPALVATLFMTCLCLPGTHRGQDATPSRNLASDSGFQPFLQAHCFDCHGGDQREGDLNLEELSKSPVNFTNGPQWATVLEKIAAGEMPPGKKQRPSEEELRGAVAWLTGGLDQAEIAFRARENRTGLRRLTRLEYRNTLRDLIGHPHDPTELLSPDAVSHGFDNIGESLVVSPFHVENFVKATDRLLDKVINIPEQPPLRQHWRILNSTAAQKPLLKDDGSWHDGHRGKNKDKIKPGFLQGNVLPNAEVPSGFTPYSMLDLAQDPPVAYEGSWDIRAFGGSQIDEGVLIREGDNAFGFKWFAYEEGTYRIRIHLSTFGPGDWKGLPPKLGIVRDPEGTLWQEHLLKLNESHIIAIDLYRDNIPWYLETNGNRHWGLKLYYQLTQEKSGDGMPVPFGLHISHIDVEGPYHPEWPPAWHRRVFPEPAADEQEEAYAKRVLATFMKRAFRRPAGEEEVARMLAIYQKERATGLSLKQALRMPLASILSSPSFLYHGARHDFAAPPGHGAWELASRLSYFLWRSMPDERLFELAQSGELLKPLMVSAEIQRMLKDPRSEALVQHFTSQWLGLDKLTKLKVDETLYPAYDLALREAMAGESTAFFREILQDELSLYQFIDSDFLMLNERLAQHYGIAGVSGNGFRKVAIGPDHPRGGVLTQAGVLTATANGLRTLPISRGAFVLEQILADPPRPPPPDVPSVDKVATAKPVATLRERLEEYLESVRDVERQLDRNQQWLDRPKPEIDPSQLQFEFKNRQEFLKVMYDLMLLALRTDATRVITMMAGVEVDLYKWQEVGVNDTYHGIQHHGGNKSQLDNLARVDKLEADLLAGFLKGLHGIHEENGSLLDRTLVLYGSGMNNGMGLEDGNGSHSTRKLPILLAGGRGLGIKQGQHLVYENDATPLCNLHLTILQAMGVEQERFVDGTGRLNGLT